MNLIARTALFIDGRLIHRGDMFTADDHTATRLAGIGAARPVDEPKPKPTTPPPSEPKMSEPEPAAPQPKPVDAKRPYKTAPKASWVTYAEQLGITTTGLSKQEIIGACLNSEKGA